MSSKASTKENGLSPVKQTRESSESSLKSSSKTATSSTTNPKYFLSMFQNSNSRPKFQRQNIIFQSSDQSLLNDKPKENSSEKSKSKDIGNKLYNPTQVSDTNKMVVSFQTGNSGTNDSSTNSSISCRSTSSALNFVSSTNGTRPANKPAAGKVLKNGSSSNSSSKDGDINKKKAGKGLDSTNTNGSSLTNNSGTKHHSSHQDNHRSSHSVPNSRNNSGGNNTKCDKKEMLEMEHSSVSTDSSTHSSNSTASKLSKIGRRLRDSCRNLRGKHSSGGSSTTHDPQDYTSLQPPNESLRSKNYVPMDFSGGEGRMCHLSDVPGNQPTKDGYTYFRRKCLSGNVKNLLTETQSSVHKAQPWFHKGVGRDASQRILATHAIDGAFLVRESSVSGGFVISYYQNGRTHHAQALPDVVDGCVTYSIDDCRTRFFDLLQMVEFYQLNRGTLSTRLTHYIVSLESAPMTNDDAVSQKKAMYCSDPEVNATKLIITKDNQNLSLDSSNPSEHILATLGTDETSSIKKELNTKLHPNGSLKLSDEMLSLRKCTASITPPESVNKGTGIEEPKSNCHLSNSPSYSQNVAKQSDDTTEELGKELSLEASTNDTNGIDNICDHTSTTDDESINNNNNNNNIKNTKISQFVAIEESATDTISNEVEPSKEQHEELNKTQLMEENKDLGYKDDFQHVQNGITDHFEVKECEKEKYPKGHE